MKQQDFLSRKYRISLTDLATEIFHLKEGQENNKLEFLAFTQSVVCNNDGFVTLWEAEQYAAAMTFIRLQAELLIYLYAELLHPERVIYKVFEEYKRLSEIRIKGKPLKQSDIREQLKLTFPEFERIWDSYHSFIHPDTIKGLALPYSEDLALNKKALSDIVKLNNWIFDTLTKVKGYYKKLQKNENE